MAITAVVAFIVQKISGLPPAAPGAGNTRYARASYQVGGDTTFSSRSRPIPDAGGDFTLFPGEWIVWGLVRGFDNAGSVTISIEIREDHGDFAAPPPLIVSGTISGPWDAITWGTVKTLGSGPTFDVLVAPRTFNTTDQGYLARAFKKKGVSGSLAITQGFLLEFDSIEGLYQPDPAAGPGVPGSKAVPGYLSRDNLGRIFTNRRSGGTWLSDTQYIEVRLRVTAFGGATFPGGQPVHWTITDEDDPTNDSPDFHRDWGPYIDANDYDGSGNPTGAKALDNAQAYSDMNADEDLLLGTGAKGNNRWAQGPGGETPAPTSRTEATSPLTVVNSKLATSSIRIHCPNVLGTNFSLAVDLDGVPFGQVFNNAITGVMTMWSRLDVEVARMDGAKSLSGALTRIPQNFLPMCVQMDFQAERVVSGALDKMDLAPDDDHEESGALAWVLDRGVFSKYGRPGWFFVGGARSASPLAPPGPKQKLLYEDKKYKLGTVALGPNKEQFAWVEVPGNASAAAFVMIDWKDGANDREASFGVVSAKFKGGKTRIVLMGNDVTPSFTGWDADGSLAHAYASKTYFFPQHHRLQSAVALAPGGFGVPDHGALISVYPPGVAQRTSGISPPVTDAASNQYFAGQTVIFTAAFSAAKFDSGVASTIVHEFIHAFGMPHKCGYWNWRTPRNPDGHTCCMNYYNTWLIDRATVASTPVLIPGFEGRMDDNACGRHLMEVRRVHLERNLGLKW